MKSNLEIVSIWEDNDMIEINIKASNEKFSGETNCYTTREEILNLAELIKGFPKSLNQEVEFSTDCGCEQSFFTLRFDCINGLGDIVLKTKITSEEKYSSEFDIHIEASAIDIFESSLRSLSTSAVGQTKAQLSGKT